MNLKNLFGKSKTSEADAGSATKVQNVTPQEAQSLLKEPGVTVLDIRTPEEYGGGHIPGAMNVDFHSTNFEVSLQQLEKGKSYIVHCMGGGRSTRSLPVFKKLGFQSIYHLDTGYKGWQKSNLPIEK